MQRLRLQSPESHTPAPLSERAGAASAMLGAPSGRRATCLASRIARGLAHWGCCLARPVILRMNKAFMNFMKDISLAELERGAK